MPWIICSHFTKRLTVEYTVNHRVVDHVDIIRLRMGTTLQLLLPSVEYQRSRTSCRTLASCLVMNLGAGILHRCGATRPQEYREKLTDRGGVDGASKQLAPWSTESSDKFRVSVNVTSDYLCMGASFCYRSICTDDKLNQWLIFPKTHGF
jgi:hypothetical protein